MVLYIIMAIVSAIFAWNLAVQAVTSVEKKHPEQFIKQLIAGAWFFGIASIFALMMSPVVYWLQGSPDYLERLDATTSVE